MKVRLILSHGRRQVQQQALSRASVGIASIRASSIRGKWRYVTGKTGTRRVPMPPVLAPRLLAQADQNGVIWRGRGGKEMSVKAVRNVYRTLFDDAGIKDKGRGGIILRHTFAAWFLAGGGCLAVLKDIMGFDMDAYLPVARFLTRQIDTPEQHPDRRRSPCSSCLLEGLTFGCVGSATAPTRCGPGRRTPCRARRRGRSSPGA